MERVIFKDEDNSLVSYRIEGKIKMKDFENGNISLKV
jgi:hypothetical protein